MDWASDDYSRVYADTYLTPAPDTGTGIYLLDDAGHDTDTDSHDHGRRCGSRCGPGPKGAPARPRREKYYTGGNIISNRGDPRAVFNVAWDERPHSGADYTRLFPPPTAHHGPPAFPLNTQPPGANILGGLNRTKEYFGGADSCGGRAPCRCGPHAAELNLQYLKVFLLIVIVVLLAMTLMAAARLARSLEKTAKSSKKLWQADLGMTTN
jgi:hypothetical protein